MSQKTKTSKAKRGAAKKPQKTKLLRQIRSIEKRADRLRETFEHEDAVESYTEALKLAKVNPGLIDVESEYELLARRVACYRRLGDSVAGPKRPSRHDQAGQANGRHQAGDRRTKYSG